jgi:hypothetical protein
MSDDDRGAGEGARPDLAPDAVGDAEGARVAPMVCGRWWRRADLMDALSVSVRTLQNHVTSGDIERREGDDFPEYRPRNTPWVQGRVQRGRKGAQVVQSTPAHRDEAAPVEPVATGDPSAVAHEELAAELADLAARVEELEELRTDVAEDVAHGTHQGEGGPSGRSEREEDTERADTLSGWRAVCVAVLVRLKLLLDAIIRAIRGERG